MQWIDLRSDTVTLPTPAMRRAMAQAEVGDDVYGEDPTVRRLEEMAAQCMGKEAALFVPSGTMANLASILVHCGRGDEMILGDRSHTFLYEQGGAAALGGIHPRTVRNLPDGTLPLEEVEAAVRPDNVHFPRTRLIVLENTHNRCFGVPLTPAYMAEARRLATRLGLRIHLDGARIFNAAVALEVEPADLAREADSVCFCLSKGLAAPAGSLICGSHAFVQEARRARKLLGGGMRQAGVLAAAGIVALKEMAGRLAEDHQNARILARGLARVEGIRVMMERVHTNMIYLEVIAPHLDAPELASRLREKGLLINATAPRQLRAVTHYGVTAEDLDRAVGIFQEVLTVERRR